MQNTDLQKKASLKVSSLKVIQNNMFRPILFNCYIFMTDTLFLKCAKI